MTERIIHATGVLWKLAGRIWLPIWARVSANSLVCFAACVILILFGFLIGKVCKKKYGEFYGLRILEHDMPFGLSFVIFLMKMFYPFMVIFLALLFVKSQIYTGSMWEINSQEVVPYTFFNFEDWASVIKVMGGAVILEFFLRSALGILTLKPLRMLRFWINTAEFMLVGWLFGNFYILLFQMAQANRLALLVLTIAQIVLDLALPWVFMISALLPLYAGVCLLLSPILCLLPEGGPVEDEKEDEKIEISVIEVWDGKWVYVWTFMQLLE